MVVNNAVGHMQTLGARRTDITECADLRQKWPLAVVKCARSAIKYVVTAHSA
jgi:hypothetical protein